VLPGCDFVGCFLVGLEDIAPLREAVSLFERLDGRSAQKVRWRWLLLCSQHRRRPPERLLLGPAEPECVRRRLS